jgi:hypothetical protein
MVYRLMQRPTKVRRKIRLKLYVLTSGLLTYISCDGRTGA